MIDGTRCCFGFEGRVRMLCKMYEMGVHRPVPTGPCKSELFG